MSNQSNGSTVQPSPPYLAFSTVLTFANHLKEHVIPDQIDNIVMSKVSFSSRSQLLFALKFFGWISGESNQPTEEFREFINADDAGRRQIMADVLRSTYPDVFAPNVDLNTITSQVLELKIAPEAKGDTLRKCFTFFVAAAGFAGIELGQFAKKRRGGTRSKKASNKGRGKPSPPETSGSENAQIRPLLSETMVRIPIALTPLRTWYVEIERTHKPSDVKRFAQIMQIVLSKDEEEDGMEAEI